MVSHGRIEAVFFRVMKNYKLSNPVKHEVDEAAVWLGDHAKSAALSDRRREVSDMWLVQYP